MQTLLSSSVVLWLSMMILGGGSYFALRSGNYRRALLNLDAIDFKNEGEVILVSYWCD